MLSAYILELSELEVDFEVNRQGSPNGPRRSKCTLHAYIMLYNAGPELSDWRLERHFSDKCGVWLLVGADERHPMVD